ncbi:TonB-dependent receptor [Dyadobacter chenwenxiniae]|uniref:TonB-dependent receptor n=1 Tax=Dyadobacter chenwenxiniae TaxID=2906456 RepID=A0A9X1PQ72_9BACT|nr:TonB-dependent receptor [Dyadobacter chenwenxiniae]MCF0062826.1 TonB-dependent receptor [Dyadobacter chenwenxiniae]UON84999.1 TonB-dependent receptor [Dyadobacter chenwenxiniae]
MKQFYLIASLVLVVGLAQAQDLVSGFVKDDSGQSLPGATIVQKGTSKYAVSEPDGKFEIAVGKEFPFTIQVSLTGYQQQEVEIYELAAEPIDVILKTANVLDQVVVIGYGTQKKGDLTGSVSSISTGDLKGVPISSLDRALQGRAAGVQVTQSSGQPGSSVSIKIRGGNSINGANEPLYVIDGFPVYNNNSYADAGVTNGPTINALSTLNPSDIESIDILKDASATAIYGSRGANGVVIITTKKGKAGKNIITYDGYYGVQKVLKTLPLLNAQQWALLKNDALIDSKKAPAFSQAEIDSLGQPGVGTDWQDAAFRQAAIQNHSLSFSGGDDKTRFAVSGNYFKQDGILQNSDFERYSFRINLDRDMSKRFKLGINFSGSKSSANVAPENVVPNLLQMPPTMPIYDLNSANGFTLRSIYDSPLANPIATLYLQVNETHIFRGFGNAYGEYQIADGLKAKVSIGTDILLNKQNRYLPSTLQEGVGLGGQGTVGNKNTIGWLNENTLSYNKSFSQDHALDAVIGITQQASTTENVVARSATFVTDEFGYHNLGGGTTFQNASSNYFKWTLLSYLGRINYTFRQKYNLTVTARADGSSRLGNDNKWGFFPSAALSWNLGREDFIKNIKEISNLKFRISGGITGNQEIAPYTSLAQEAYYSYLFGRKLVAGYAPNGIANPNLGWEQTAQYDAGLDLGFFKNRINVTLDAYYKKTSDLLLDVPLPYTSGYANAFQNYGAVENKGIELSVNTVNSEGALGWTTDFVFSTNKNKVLSLGPGVSQVISGNSIAQVGSPIGSFLVLKADGIFQTGDDIANLPKFLASDRAGSQRYVDISGPNGVPDGTITQAHDRVIVGNAQPKFLYGLTNNFTFKGFDLNVLLQGQSGNKVYNANQANLELGTGYINGSTTMLDRWTPTNPSNVIHRAIENPAVTVSDRFIENGSYLRLKNLSLGYSLPAALTGKIGISQLRIYVTAQNLVTWTKYTGYDPEVSRNEQATLTQGVDNGVYPASKTFLGGLTLTF